ncbi:MAG: hypothetical protein DWQ40_06570 [Actinobacteria bacterium]|nr:MAG: hypothetical protein DWQ40_06570 [Actinomycetota bacterium]
MVEPSADDFAKMSAQAIDVACGRQCERLVVYVVTEIEDFLADGEGAALTAMTDETKAAIERAVPDAEFVSAAEAAGLISEGSVDGGRGVIVNVTDIESEGENLVSIEVALTVSDGEPFDSIHRFEWDGERWAPTEQPDLPREDLDDPPRTRTP